ncbi:MAG: cytochrome c maturation protein CcmE [Eggerthellaceae bacterium]|nr:cytochrome c maturation protein CcmE [Eggerthellaceae bacterium]
MGAKMKKRLIVVSGILLIVVIAMLAVVGGGSAATNISVAQAAKLSSSDQKVQVSGNVVPDSYSSDGSVLTFSLYDPEDDPSIQLQVIYNGSASSTFGNNVTAICTGRMDGSGALQCTELVTKCPSKYENTDSALSVSRLRGYGDGVIGKMVKVTGVVQGDVNPADQRVRFKLSDPADGSTIEVIYAGSLSEDVVAGASVVITGDVDEEGAFTATDVSLEG